MNKTIFQIDYKLSVLIVSIVGVVNGFISNGYMISGVLPLLFYLIKLVVLSGLYLVFYLIENKNNEFKNKLKSMFGYLIVFHSVNFICIIFSLTHILSWLFLTVSSMVSLYVIVSFIMEILVLYFNNKIIEKVVEFNKKIGDAIANPIVNFFNKKITND